MHSVELVKLTAEELKGIKEVLRRNIFSAEEFLYTIHPH